MQLIRAEHQPAQAWRNGGGQTRELLALPGGKDWAVRLSLADIDTDGPFSAFPGVARWFAVVQGAGVRLSFAQGVRLQQPAHEPLAFDGALAPGCQLIDGPTRDLNLMLRGAHGVMQRAMAGAAWNGDFTQRGFFSRVAGTLMSVGGAVVSVPAQTLAWALPAGPNQFAPAPPDSQDSTDAPVAPDFTPPCGWWLGVTLETS